MVKCSAAAAWLVAAASVYGAEPVPLRMNLSVGQSWALNSSQVIDGKGQLVAGGQTQTLTTRQEQRRGGTVQVLAVANGVPTSMKVTYDQNCSTTQSMNDQQTPTPFAYAGRTVTVTRNPDGTVTDDFTGQAPPGDQTDLHALLDQDLVIMPAKPVAVGEEWSADPRVAGRVLGISGRDQGGITLKLLSTAAQNNRPTAEVKVSMAVLKDEQGMKAKIIAQGTCTVDLQTGHVTRAAYDGNVTIDGQQQANGPDGQPMAISVSSQGTVKITGDAPLTGAAPAPAPAPLPGGDDASKPPVPAPAPNPLAGPAPFAGTYADAKLKVELRPKGEAYEGTFTLGGNSYPATAALASGQLSGTFTAGGQSFPFTAALEGGGIELTSGATVYHLKRAATNPLDGGAPAPAGPVNPLGPRNP